MCIRDRRRWLPQPATAQPPVLGPIPRLRPRAQPRALRAPPQPSTLPQHTGWTACRPRPGSLALAPASQPPVADWFGLPA
eukprot:12097159-Alexandrium_andersonii.AAC.1